MKVCLLTAEPYHDNSLILGAFASLELAMAHADSLQPGLDWQRDGFYVDNWEGVTAWADCPRDGMTDKFMIYELEVMSMGRSNG